MLYDVLLPSFVSGIVGYQVSRALGVSYFHPPHELLPDFSEAGAARYRAREKSLSGRIVKALRKRPATPK